MKDEDRKAYAEQLAPYAREFVVGYEDMTVTISRYTNHGRLLKDNGWAVSIHGDRGTGLTNHHYLSTDGEWRYKNGNTFATPELALSYLYKFGTPNRAKLLEERGPTEDKLEAGYRV